MWHSAYQRPMVPNIANPREEILEPLSKMTEGDKKKYIADERIKRLMHGSDITSNVRHSRLIDEFDKFSAKEGESLDSVYERLTALVNIMDRYGRIANKNLGRNRNQMFNAGNASDESNQIVHRIPRTDSTQSKEKCAMQKFGKRKDEAGSHLNNKENDFMLDNAYGEESSASHQGRKRERAGAMKERIIFDDPYMDNNGGTTKHDSIAHEENHAIQMLAYNVQREAEKQKRMNNELKKQKDLLQQELKTFKDQVKVFESKTAQCSEYKETCEDLTRELRNDKDTID
ncbi:hypothetical protein Tco_0714881 [Tanacetum coccineum]